MYCKNKPFIMNPKFIQKYSLEDIPPKIINRLAQKIKIILVKYFKEI